MIFCIHTQRICRSGVHLYSVFFLMLTLPGSVQSQTSYRDFLEVREFYDSGTLLMENGQYKKALYLFQQAAQDPGQKLSALNGAAICYMKLKDEQKALAAIEEAFRNGYLLRYMEQDKPLLPLRPKMEELFATLRPRYLETLDTLLRRELKNMVMQDQQIRSQIRTLPEGQEKDSARIQMLKTDNLNIVRLKEIERQYGWPGFKLIGNRQTYPDDSNPDVTLLVAHAGEADNLFFLEAVMKKIVKKEASWWDAYDIMKNLVFRFNEDGYNKLRQTVLDNEGHLDIDQSFFQLKVLADFLSDNPTQKITLAVVQYEDESESTIVVYQKSLKAIRDFLVKEGTPVKSITIRDKVLKVKDDGLGKYRVALFREH
jgi:tetratricopeptide (TPR) repeat protein